MQTNSNKNNTTRFAPMLYLKNVADGIEFYKEAFNAKEIRRFSNDDGSVHVAEMTIENAMFHIHEEGSTTSKLSPATLGGTTTVLGIFVEDPDALMSKAIAAGATEISPMQDFDYGYRQGDIKDPFGHNWTFQKSI
ncbi:VOC family protein [Panacibacter ginsenosidivorans]|uniref:VOC family protein n=1 Tax=Panacibacter ginsenosidivorans TaxID=1813871 RepID=A0A5B8V5A7_9BACT|nr:VOC family protein [Panacibacter ginsenosidivorans]QEC66369.1 VOC family protein [Panacibacter ginsenosidivorans]